MSRNNTDLFTEIRQSIDKIDERTETFHSMVFEIISLSPEVISRDLGVPLELAKWIQNALNSSLKDIDLKNDLTSAEKNYRERTKMAGPVTAESIVIEKMDVGSDEWFKEKIENANKMFEMLKLTPDDDDIVDFLFHEAAQETGVDMNIDQVERMYKEYKEKQ